MNLVITAARVTQSLCTLMVTVIALVVTIGVLVIPLFFHYLIRRELTW
jgi:hypothetical protein